MFEQVTEFLTKVGASITASLIMQRLRAVLPSLTPRRALASHLKNLEQTVRGMPFIYRDLDGDIINDFVDIEMERIDLRTLRAIPKGKIFNVTNDQRLRDNRKLIFLGNAGVGKTTFQRHVILDLIRKRAGVRFLYPGEKVVPFYVPLRAIDNMIKFPILRYIVTSSGLGFRRLQDLASKGRLFLFLDGYDEIPFANPEKLESNFVQEELGIIISPKRGFATPFKSPEERGKEEQIYASMDVCRVWLSSRREFFESYPIGMDDKNTDGRLSTLKALELTGIGANRLVLVQKIFGKYKARSKLFGDLLNEEYFIQDVDDSNDEELRRLSYNPLFLTIMCYIYASKAIEARDYRIHWRDSLYDLILECIKLLLRDLDEAKARDLPRAHREALLKRRNTYIEEKEAFLKFFAFKILIDEKGIFDLEYIKDSIRAFLTEEFQSPVGSRIIEELTETKASYPNMSLQLVFSGVFVIVDRNKSAVLYDFPHRRFREVLACEYISEPKIYIQLLENLNKTHLSEFLRVFYESPPFKSRNLHERTLAAILEEARRQPLGSGRYRLITERFIRIKPSDYDPSKAIGDFLDNCLGEQAARFDLSIELLKNFKPEPLFMERVVEALRYSLEHDDPERLSLCCALLRFYNKTLLQYMLSGAAEREWSSINREVATVIFYWLYQVSPGSLLTLVAEMSDKSDLLLCLLYGLAVQATVETVGGEFWRAFAEKLAEEQRLIFFYFAWLCGNPAYPGVQEACGFDLPASVFECARFELARSASFPSSKSKNRIYFFVTRDLVDRLRQVRVPTYLVKTELRNVSVRLKDSDKEINTVKEERFYARFDGEHVLGGSIIEVEEMLYQRFVSEDVIREKLEKAIVWPFRSYIAQLEFTRRAEQRPGARTASEREQEVEVFEKQLEAIRGSYLRVEVGVYVRVASLLGRVSREFKTPNLCRYFY